MTFPNLWASFPERKRPEILFHYTSPAALYGIVLSKTLWATNIHYLNDAKEFRHAIEIAQGILRRQLGVSNSDLAIKILEGMAEILDRAARMTVCVFSLSEQGNVLSQWRAYCAGGGFALGFETERLHLLAQGQQFNLAACVYDANAQRRVLAPIIEWHLTQSLAVLEGKPELAEKDLAARLDLWVADFVRVAPLLKDRAFEEEREWRMISRPYFDDTPALRFRPGKFMMIPYLEFHLTNSGEQLEIAEIVVGPSANWKLANESVIQFLTNRKVKWRSVRPSHVPFREW